MTAVASRRRILFRNSLIQVLGPPKLSTTLRALHPGSAEDLKDVNSLEFLDLPDGHSAADLHGALLRKARSLAGYRLTRNPTARASIAGGSSTARWRESDGAHGTYPVHRFEGRRNERYELDMRAHNFCATHATPAKVSKSPNEKALSRC